MNPKVITAIITTILLSSALTTSLGISLSSTGSVVPIVDTSPRYSIVQEVPNGVGREFVSFPSGTMQAVNGFRSRSVGDEWDFDMIDSWCDFVAMDDDSAELAIGFSDTYSNRTAELVQIVMKNGGKVIDAVLTRGQVKAAVVEMPLEAVSSFVEEVKGVGLARYVEPNLKFEIDVVPNDPGWPLQWGPKIMEVDDAWKIQRGSADVLIAIVDTGVDWDHPDLAANIWNNTDEVIDGTDTDGNGYIDDVRGYDFVDTTEPVYPGEDGTVRDNDPMDFHGHGTHCAGIVAAVTHNRRGIAGVSWNSKIMAVRAGYKSVHGHGYLDADDVADAIVYAADNGADIISMSFGSLIPSKLIYDAVKYACDSGVLLVASAGNDGWDLENYPAAFDEVMAVTATDSNDSRAYFSNYGEWVEVAAPGVDIYSTITGDSYANKSGTSMSAPHVAGVAALALSQFPGITARRLRTQLVFYTDDLGAPGFDIYYGHGRVNAREAVEQTVPEHDLLVWTHESPQCIEPGGLAVAKVTMLNLGASDEDNISVQLLVNGSLTESRSIELLESGMSVKIDLSWAPTIVGRFNLTYYVMPVPGETVLDNNVKFTFVTVRVPTTLQVPEEFDSIHSALDYAIRGDTIRVAAGVYWGGLTVEKSVKIVAEDRSNTIIFWIGKTPVVHVTVDDVTIKGFKLIMSGSPHIGIYLDHSANSNVVGNSITRCAYGVRLDHSEDSIIADNHIYSNYIGIVLNSDSSVISGNTIGGNRGIGMDVSGNHNHIFHNNFIRNRFQAKVYGGTETWDEGYPSGGNYWSDYDSKGGYDADGDGIGDISYIIDAYNEDRYPLMNPWDTIPPVANAGPDQTVYENTSVTLDGSGSSDNVGIVSYVWTFLDVTPKTLTGVHPTYTFMSPSIYTVTLNVSDAAGNHAIDTVTVTVLSLTPENLTQRLIETIETCNLSKGTENSLTSNLDDAIHLLNKGNENGALHKLMDFIDQVEALRGKKLTNEQADYLTAEAQRIINLIKG